MNGHGQSDRCVVPANPPNKAAAAEAGEERERAKGNTASETRLGRSAGSGVSSELDRVRQVARRDKDARFTALLHNVSLERLVMAYWDLSPKASPGVDGVTWQDYGQDLVANLRDLHLRLVVNAPVVVSRGNHWQRLGSGRVSVRQGGPVCPGQAAADIASLGKGPDSGTPPGTGASRAR
jgi:hypothetical protein